MTRVIVAANPVAGGGRGVRQARALEQELRRRGFATDIVPTGPACDEAFVASIASADVAVAVGGDGTLNRVVFAALQGDDAKPRPAIAFLACGTGNVAARAFDLPRRPAAVARLIAEGATRPIDVGIISRDRSRIGVFLLWLGAGVDAELIELVAQTRARRRGLALTASYAREALRLLFTYRFPEISITTDAVAGPFAAVMAANVGRLAIGSVTRYADPSDGLLNVIATESRPRRKWLGATILAALDRYDRCPGVTRTSTSELQISSSTRVAVHADGEPMGALPVEVAVLPAAVRLCAP